MLDLEKFLPYRLSVLSNRISQKIAEIYQTRYGLNVTEWRVIAILARYPGISATEVTRRSAMDKVAVSRAVRSLLDDRRIDRTLNHADRRTKLLELTPEGRRLVEAITPAALAYEKALLDALGPADRQALDRVLDQLNDAVRPCPSPDSRGVNKV